MFTNFGSGTSPVVCESLESRQLFSSGLLETAALETAPTANDTQLVVKRPVAAEPDRWFWLPPPRR